MVPKYPFLVICDTDVGGKRVRRQRNYENMVAATACYQILRGKPSTKRVQVCVVIHDSRPDVSSGEARD